MFRCSQVRLRLSVDNCKVDIIVCNMNLQNDGTNEDITRKRSLRIFEIVLDTSEDKDEDADIATARRKI